MSPISINPARLSEQTELKTKIIFVDYSLIGTHENCSEKWVSSVLSSFLNNGFQWPLITVVEHERDEIFNNTKEAIPRILSWIKYWYIWVADGHHRLKLFETLDHLWILKSKTIPVQIIPWQSPEIVRLETPDKSEHQLVLSDITKHFWTPTSTISDTCSARFEVNIQNQWYLRVQYWQPDVAIKAEDLFDVAKLKSLNEEDFLVALRKNIFGKRDYIPWRNDG